MRKTDWIIGIQGNLYLQVDRSWSNNRDTARGYHYKKDALDYAQIVHAPTYLAPRFVTRRG
jgi:hypothetical protein